MNEDTKKKLEEAIVACAEHVVRRNTTPLESLQATQAALNAANAIATLEALRKDK